MSRILSFLASLRRSVAGTMAVETAFVVPVLGVLCLGGLETSLIVARNTELQTALAEAAAITLARAPQTDEEIDTLVGIVAASAGLSLEEDANEVVMERLYRCGLDDEVVESESDCASGETISSYLRLTLNDTYDPTWTSFGIGSTVEFSKTRMLQIS